jgi:hypothetical protein
MAAGSFHVFDVWRQELGQNGGGISTATFIADLCSASRAPTLADLSSTALVDKVTQSGYATQVLASVEWSSISSGTWRMDAADFAFTTSAIMTPKYCVISRQVDGKLVCVSDLNTGSLSGVQCTQANITVPASGFFKLSGATL